MNKLQLIDADTLYYKPLAHPKMLIDGVLSDGLAILAGDSKIGKSWMVLWLCLQISRGEAVWGLPTRKTDVVYLALEDREWRVQQRMQELTDSPPENLRFGFSCGQLGAELEGQIEETLREFPSTGLIFIDTLQMVRDNASAKVNAYAQDYKDLSGLKKLADDHGICSKHLTRHYSDVLLPLGITYEYRKTAAARLVLLELHDGADGHDGSSGSERLASLRKQNDGIARLPQASSQASSVSWGEAEDDEALPL